MRYLLLILFCFSLALGPGWNGLAAAAELEEELAKVKPEKSGYDLLIDVLKYRPLLEQLNADIVNRVALWQSSPEDALRFGNYYIEQIKEYWKEHPALAQEVSLEVSPEAVHLVQMENLVGVLRSLRLSERYDALATQTKRMARKDAPETVVKGDAQNPRQVLKFKYIGGDDPQTPLGAYLQHKLDPFHITLEFDPQGTMIGGMWGFFGEDFAQERSILAVGPHLMAAILMAEEEDDLFLHS